MPAVWESINFVNQHDIHITLLNMEGAKEAQTSYSNVTTVIGDARDMAEFKDQQFDVVYSNSVIEHVGDSESRRRMASEVRRVGKRYFVQTPNLYFPIEPHFVFPLFQFLPISVRIYLVQNFDLGWLGRIPERERAEQEVRSINLLSKREVRSLFPDGELYQERFAGLVKSLLAYKM